MADKKTVLTLVTQRSMLKKCGLKTSGQRLTYMMLLHHANADGMSAPGNPTLTEYVGCGERQTSSNIQAIKKAGLAKPGDMVRFRNGEGEFYTARAWHIKLPKITTAGASAERDDAKSKKTKRKAGDHECRCEGKDHTNDAACRQYRSYRKKKGKTPAPAPRAAAPKPKPAPPTKAELQATAERQRKREEQKAEAQRIEDARYKCLCPKGPHMAHTDLEVCKRVYPDYYRDDGAEDEL